MSALSTLVVYICRQSEDRIEQIDRILLSVENYAQGTGEGRGGELDRIIFCLKRCELLESSIIRCMPNLSP